MRGLRRRSKKLSDERDERDERWRKPSKGGFWYGVGEALLVPLVFTALGLSWWGVALRAQAVPAAYPGDMGRTLERELERAAESAAELWLVDGFNVVQVALLAGRDRASWWTAPHRAELLRRARAFDGLEGADDATGAPRLWVVFDGGRQGQEEAAQEAAPVRTVFAPSADAWVLARVRRAPDPGRVRVVTADRRLAARARHHGAQVIAPAAFLGRCGAREGASDPAPERGEITTI